jgi:hypothetical protein
MTFKHCPIYEQTADGTRVGRCWHTLSDQYDCPRHGDVAAEYAHFLFTGRLTLENRMRERKGLPLLGKDKQ